MHDAYWFHLLYLTLLVVTSVLFLTFQYFSNRIIVSLSGKLLPSFLFLSMVLIQILNTRMNQNERLQTRSTSNDQPYSGNIYYVTFQIVTKLKKIYII